MNKLLYILPIIFLGACATTRQTAPTIITKIETVKVEIPIVQPCVTEEISYPELLINKLKPEDESDPGKVVQYYVADVAQLKGAFLRQKKLLDACKIIDSGASPSEPKIVAPTAPVQPKPTLQPETKPVQPKEGTFLPPPPPNQ